MKGTYIIVIFLKKDSIIRIGALGEINFREGYYIYVGSAMGTTGATTIRNRVKRHVSDSLNKKVFWHIDYLLKCKDSSINRLYLIPSPIKFECVIANDLLNCAESFIQNFGSSDCKCKSHLFYFGELPWYLL
ncbi:MAG: GIY-YIG nuclease family protein [Candidatus Lokiarchaeota archaeon]|nr:GIY-YIG nuclease family protein [Candidatus Lokiarchaeota archaeon]